MMQQIVDQYQAQVCNGAVVRMISGHQKLSNESTAGADASVEVPKSYIT